MQHLELQRAELAAHGQPGWSAREVDLALFAIGRDSARARRGQLGA